MFKEEKWIATACAIALFVFMALLVKDEVTMTGIEASRFATIQSLAERGSFAIEDADFRTVDFIRGQDGRIYSDKPWPFQVACAAVMKLNALFFGVNFHDKYHLAIYLNNLLCVSSLTVLAFMIFLRRISIEAPGSPFKSRLLLSLSMILSTWLLSYGVCLNNHIPAALLLLVLMFQLFDYGTRDKTAWAFLAGLTAGALFDVEIPVGGIFGLVSFAVVAAASKERRLAKLAAYSLGGVLPILGMGLLNYCVLGQFKPQYVGAGGTFQIPLPVLDPYYFFSILFGARGFFIYMPALFVGALVAFATWRTLDFAKRAVLCGACAVILFYGFFTNEYGGWAYGFRYLIPLIPVFWYFLAKDFAPRWGARRYFCLCALLLWGLLTSYVGALNPWCNAFEGAKTEPGKIDYEVRNTFLSNLLYASYKSDPDSLVSRLLVEKVYGPRVAGDYLYEAFINTKEFEQIAKMKERVAKRGGP